jgi:hypothetical protein
LLDFFCNWFLAVLFLGARSGGPGQHQSGTRQTAQQQPAVEGFFDNRRFRLRGAVCVV